MRILKLSAPLVLTCALLLGGQGMRVSHADTGTLSYHFWGLVTQGPDAGTVLEGLLDVTAGTGSGVSAVLTMGNASAINATGSAMGKSLTLKFPSTGIGGSLIGMGTKAGTGWVGSFTGPKMGDRGTWRAALGVSTINYAITGTVSKGPSKGKALIGDLFGIIEADGTMTGRYVDNSQIGPGVVINTYPVHGFYVNNNLVAAIRMGGMKMGMSPTVMIVGHATTFFGQQAINGALVGPKSGDSGVVSGVAQQ